MRSSQAKRTVWPFVRNAADAPADEPREESFGALGPISGIRKALHRPARPPLSQAPHDFTRILVAEDDAFHRRVLRMLLTNPSVSIIEVEDGQAAVDLLALRSFDAVLLDLTLPLMTGEDVIRWVRRSQTLWADIPILGLVEDSMRPLVGRLMSMGMTDWTAKPLARHDLAEKIVNLLPGLYDTSL